MESSSNTSWWNAWLKSKVDLYLAPWIFFSESSSERFGNRLGTVWRLSTLKSTHILDFGGSPGADFLDTMTMLLALGLRDGLITPFSNNSLMCSSATAFCFSFKGLGFS